MKARKVALLMLILGFGALTEITYSVHNNLAVGPAGCRVLGGKFYGPSFSFETESRYPLAAPAAVELENAFGSVRVGRGGPDEARVVLRKVVFLQSDEQARAFASRIELDAHADGALLKLATNRESLERSAPEIGFETHLELTLPEGTELRVRNEHGSVEIEDVAAADVDSSYESVRIERVPGAVDLRARHADVSIASVAGPLTLRTRHGDVDIQDARGALVLEVRDGDVRASRVGPLTLELSNGNLLAGEVQGDLRIEAKNAALEASEVHGSVIAETSYRDVDVRKVTGEARVRALNGSIRLAAVGGAVSAVTSYDDVELEDIEGSVEVEVSHGGVRATNLSQGARIKSSGDDVVLLGFAGPVSIEARRGDVRLSTTSALGDALFVSAPHGAIQLDVPVDSGFELEVVAPKGKIDVPLPGFAITDSATGRLTGRMGTGGPKVELRSERGDVSLRAQSIEAAEAP